MVEVELGWPWELDQTLNFGGSACKLRWETQLYYPKSCPLGLKDAKEWVMVAQIEQAEAWRYYKEQGENDAWGVY